jgi:hypothetical protein
MRRAVVAATAALALSCGGGSKAVRPGGAPDAAPSWLSEGTGAVRAEGGRKLQGVGVASGVTNEKARRRQADSAAREQLQAAVDALARALAKDRSAQDGQAVAAMARKAAAQVSAIRDHWVTPDGDERALAVVEVEEFKKALQGVDGDERVRREMFANVDGVFEQLSRAR